MQHTISAQQFHGNEQNVYISGAHEKYNLFSSFFIWCQAQEDKKFFWLAISFLGNIGMVLPITLVAILLSSGGNFTLLTIVAAVNVPVLALNLAAQSPKVTLPVLFFAWIVDALIILYCMIAFLWI